MKGILKAKETPVFALLMAVIGFCVNLKFPNFGWLGTIIAAVSFGVFLVSLFKEENL